MSVFNLCFLSWGVGGGVEVDVSLCLTEGGVGVVMEGSVSL